MNKLIYLVPLFLLFGCAEKSIEYNGTCSFEDSKKSTLTNVMSVLYQDGCDKIDKVHYSFIDKKKNITREHWYIFGCNKKFEYLVRYEQEDCKRLYTGVSKIK